MKMTTTTNEDDARNLMLSRNRTRRGRTDMAVMVDGPGDGEFTVMSLRDAIGGGFTYRWEV
jgi:hypothetical protein